MGRNHIHCARGLFGEEGVQSGASVVTLPRGPRKEQEAD